MRQLDNPRKFFLIMRNILKARIKAKQLQARIRKEQLLSQSVQNCEFQKKSDFTESITKTSFFGAQIKGQEVHDTMKQLPHKNSKNDSVC